MTPLPKVISRNHGSDLTITCNATGRPVPTLSWLKGGNTLQTAQGIEVTTTTLSDTVYSILSITSIKDEHQGMYTCLASNALPNGTLTHTSSFTLNIIGQCNILYIRVALTKYTCSTFDMCLKYM